MLSLLLLRHAKSSWDNPKLDDFDRPLAPRGIKAAPKIGAYIQRRELLPDLVLCSTAQRARETLSLIIPYLACESTIRMQRKLYHSESANALLDHIRQQDSRFKTIMLVGHNPALHDLATTVVKSGSEQYRKQLAEKFPTAALAVIRFKTSDWRSIDCNGNLDKLVLPRLLD